MKFKKVFAGFLSVSILSLSTITAFAAGPEDLRIISDAEQIKEILPQSYFNSFTGVVKKITDREGVKGSKMIYVINEEGLEANIIVSDDTYIVNNAEIMTGAVITGFYESNAPMIMIYPAQYNAKVVAVQSQAENVKVDMFGKDLVSADNTLKLNISDATEIISQTGKSFKGDLAGGKLVVLYGPSTRSIPAQTNPIKVIVLDDAADMDIIVDNKKIDGPRAYTNEQGTIMVPLRAAAEALGFEVAWDGESKSIMVGKGISLKIGQDNYIYMKTAPIQLGTAPEAFEGRTFVPLNFFREVMRMNNAYVFEGQIVIDNGEKME